MGSSSLVVMAILTTAFCCPEGREKLCSRKIAGLFIADEIILCYSVSCRTLTMYWSVAARLHNPYICKGKRCIWFTRPLVTICQIHSRDDRNREAVKHSHHAEREKNVFSYLPPMFKTISARSWAISWTFGDISLLLFKDHIVKIKQIWQPTVDRKTLRDDVWNVPDSEDLVAEKRKLFHFIAFIESGGIYGASFERRWKIKDKALMCAIKYLNCFQTCRGWKTVKQLYSLAIKI